MKHKIFYCILIIFSTSTLNAKNFDVMQEVAKCQKCHGVKFDKEVLNSSKKISSLSEKEILESFEKYLKVSNGGKAGLMKIIAKKYTKEERKTIIEYIYKQTH